jgi:hypothetical protein
VTEGTVVAAELAGHDARVIMGRNAPSRNGDQAARGAHIQLDRGPLVQAARVGQDEAGRGRTAKCGVAAALVQDGHDLDIMHGLRPGRVIVKDVREQAIRGSHRADRRPQGRTVRARWRQPREYVCRGRRPVSRQSLPFAASATRGPAHTITVWEVHPACRPEVK